MYMRNIWEKKEKQRIRQVTINNRFFGARVKNLTDSTRYFLNASPVASGKPKPKSFPTQKKARNQRKQHSGITQNSVKKKTLLKENLLQKGIGI